MIKINNITLTQGSQTLIANGSATINPGYKVGVVGRNGTGKTSLFKAILGQLELTQGEIELPEKASIAYIEQEIESLNLMALDYVLKGHPLIFAIYQKLLQAEAADDMASVAELHHQLSENDGYRVRAEAGKIMLGLGFAAHQLESRVAEFSGGWRMRLHLARCLLCPADIMFLDEPTNHLDLPAIVWLSDWLRDYRGTLFLISHDRDFLDETITHILHLDGHSLKLYTGDYSNFIRQRAEALAVQSAQYQKQQTHITHMMRYVERFRYKASKAKQAQSRLKAIERIAQVPPVLEEGAIQLEFMTPLKTPTPLIALSQASVGYDQQVILGKLNLTLSGQARIGLLGMNGAGKSTLIKLLAGEKTVLQGEYERHTQINVGYFAQHQVEQLNESQTALNYLQEHTRGETVSALRALLGRYGFSGEKALQPIATLSGGEKARLVLALIIWRRPNLLLLDEPTNHLDLQLRDSLNQALQTYPGALVLVSHDRYLLRTTVDDFWLVANHTVKPFQGDLEDYKQEISQAKPSAKNVKNTAPVTPARAAKFEKQLERLERDLAKLHDQLAEIDQKIADELLKNAGQQSGELLAHAQKREEILKKVSRCEEEWYGLQG